MSDTLKRRSIDTLMRLVLGRSASALPSLLGVDCDGGGVVELSSLLAIALGGVAPTDVGAGVAFVGTGFLKKKGFLAESEPQTPSATTLDVHSPCARG